MPSSQWGLVVKTKTVIELQLHNFCSFLGLNMAWPVICFGWLLLYILDFFSLAWSKLLCRSQLLWDQATKQSGCRLRSENISFDVYRWCLIAAVSLSTSIIEILIVSMRCLIGLKQNLTHFCERVAFLWNFLLGQFHLEHSFHFISCLTFSRFRFWFFISCAH